MKTKTGTTRLLKYVPIYEILYGRIAGGEYAANTQLPTEQELSDELQVSRGSLRQALNILREDGLIYSIQGKGSFVSENAMVGTVPLNNLTCPIYSTALEPITSVKMDFSYQPPAAIVQEKLGINSFDISLISNATYFNEMTPIAQAFYSIPMKYFSFPDVDLNTQEAVQKLVENLIYKASDKSTARISISETRGSLCRNLKVKEGSPVIFIEDVLYGSQGKAIALCKYYMLPAHYQINVVRK